VRRIISVAIAAMIAGCTLFTPFGTDLTSGDPIVIEAGAPDGTTPANDAGGGTDGGTSPDGATLSDAASDAGTGCAKKGDVVRPIRAFDATPPEVDAGTPSACSIDSVLVEDGIVAGLDRNGTAYKSIDGQGIVSCIGVEMAPGVVIDRVLVRARAAGDACGGSPCDPSTPGGCGSGHSFPIYVGTTATDLVMAMNGNDVNATLQTIDVPAPATVSARFVVVCRSTWGLERDDIAVDSIAAICR